MKFTADVPTMKKGVGLQRTCWLFAELAGGAVEGRAGGPQ